MAELPQREILIIIVIGSCLILFLVGSIAVFITIYQKRLIMEQERQKKLEQIFQHRMVHAQLQSQENERKRIAADLHDSLGSLLSGAKLNALFLERSLPLIGDAKSAYTDLLTSLEQAVEAVKRISWELTPGLFHSLGLCESVRLLCERLNGKGLTVAFKCDHTDLVLNDDRALSVYRIIQELISNSLQHSKALVVNVSIEFGKDVMVVTVQDNGIGFSIKSTGTGFGWWNIKLRVKQLQAKMQIGVPPIGNGSFVQIQVPFIYEHAQSISS
ncbi:MAG: hypothetical protein HRU69_12415 [Flammeovirgaceae bacterium]|nr:MAG: hypothetical protein HRU69_12415 [Flammeovirgaceae bacterium]